MLTDIERLAQLHPALASYDLQSFEARCIKFYTWNDIVADPEDREIRWWGSSYKDLLCFPAGARKTAGHQLGRIQAGLDPENWKPFDDVGSGTREIRIREDGSQGKGIFRVMYVAKFEEAIHVLHCFQKTSQVTSSHDKRIASDRYKAMIASRISRK